MKSIFGITATLLAMLSGTLLPAAEETIHLKQAFPVGKKIYQSTAINQTMNMGGVPGAPREQGIDIKNKILMDLSIDIKNHNGDQKKAVVRYEKMSMLIDAGSFKKEFASDADDGNPFTLMAGKEMAIIYDKEDRVQSVEGIAELFGEASDQSGAGDVFSQMFSQDQVKESINQGLLQVVPDKALRVGESWPYTMETSMPQGMGEMKVAGNYTLKRLDEFEGYPCAVIGMEGKLESDGKGTMELQGKEIELEFGDSTFEGEIYFDNQLGLPRKSDMLTKMKLTMGLEEQSMLMDMTMTMINKITKVEDNQ